MFSDWEERLSDFDVALVEVLVTRFLRGNIDRQPDEFRLVTRAHVLAWCKVLEDRAFAK